MFSQKNLSILLIIAIVLISLQTYTLFNLNQKLKEAKLNFGAGSSAVTLSTGGSAPDMVGGC